MPPLIWRRLLHGDLHRSNILLAQTEWIAIDPKGVADELNLDRERMLAYGVAHSVLSAWWSYEDSRNEWESACACGEALASLMSQ